MKLCEAIIICMNYENVNIMWSLLLMIQFPFRNMLIWFFNNDNISHNGMHEKESGHGLHHQTAKTFQLLQETPAWQSMKYQTHISECHWVALVIVNIHEIERQQFLYINSVNTYDSHFRKKTLVPLLIDHVILITPI